MQDEPNEAERREPKELDRVDWLIMVGLAVSYVILLLLTAKSQGYARDEGFYFRAAESYARWFELLLTNTKAAFLRSNIDSAFSVNHEHPALVKSLFSLSWLFLYKKWHLFSEEGTSFRFAGMCFAGMALSVIYAWGRQAINRLTGVSAALLFALVPTTFYHSHLDCFDVPITAMWLLCAYCIWRALLEGGAGWALLTGVVYGLTLDTKHNSWFLPFYVVALAIAMRGRNLERDFRLGHVRMPLVLITMLTIGPVVFVLGWPWLWFDTAARFGEYVSFHMNHDYYNIELFGETYFKPPFPRAWPWVMTFATIPMVTLILFVLGLVIGGASLFEDLRERRKLERLIPSTYLAWVLGVLVGYGPWVSRSTPIFGGTKHWMTAYPFMMLLAGAGVKWVYEQIGPWAIEQIKKLSSGVVEKNKNVVERLVPSVLVVVLCLAPAVQTFHSHPWGLTGYVASVGGAVGAANMGLNRSFWGYTTGSVIDVLNLKVPKNGSVYIHDTAWDSWRMLQRDGRLRNDIRGVGSPAYADAALYHHEQHMAGVEHQIWLAMGTTTPTAVKGLDGVPIVWVYTREGRANPEPR